MCSELLPPREKERTNDVKTEVGRFCKLLGSLICRVTGAAGPQYPAHYKQQVFLLKFRSYYFGVQTAVMNRSALPMSLVVGLVLVMLGALTGGARAQVVSAKVMRSSNIRRDGKSLLLKHS